jgi:hypothetical protein
MSCLVMRKTIPNGQMCLCKTDMVYWNAYTSVIAYYQPTDIQSVIQKGRMTANPLHQLLPQIPWRSSCEL